MGKKRKILLVEDEVLIALSEKQELEEYNYEVTTVTSGEEAIKYLDKTSDTDLILMDINLKHGIDGTEAAQEILENHNVPILFLSSHSEPEIVEKTEKITSYGYVVKNSGIVVLDASIKMALKLFNAKKSEKIKHELLKKNEDRLNKIILAANDGMWDWDLITNKVYFDPRYYLMSGYKINEFPHTLEEFQNRVHPDDIGYVMEEASKHLNGEVNRFNVEFRFLKKTGDWQWIQGKGVIVERNEDGLPQRFVGTHRDICELKLKENLLQESELTFRKLFEESSDAILLIDQTGVFIECNNAALELLKMTRQQFLFKPPVEISPEYQPDGQNSGEKALKMIELAFARGLNRFDWLCVNSEGNEFFVEVSLMPIRLKGELMLHTTWRDITVRKQAEEVIKGQLKEKEVLLREAHHRIKNNIASIEAFLSLQARSADNDAVKIALQQAITRVQSSRILYEKLLLKNDYQDIFIKNYIDSLIDSLVVLFPDAKNISIERKLSNFSISSNKAVSLGIIITELLTNIFKYAFNGEDKGTILINLANKENSVELVLKDNGIGMDERVEENKSPGFGLTIVTILAEQLGGTFTMDYDNGTRSVLKFEI